MSLDAPHWDRLQELFHLAAGVPEADRDRILTEACDEPDLRERVLTILRAAGKSELEPPVCTVPDYMADRSGVTVIGPYTVIQRLGAGGTGTVYLVERDAGGVRQRAALKVLSAHARGPSDEERFRREQHILASLDHPNITRMLDAGVADTGQPYLVMEYVEGQYLDAYCDERRLSVEDRLRHFLKVCEAVDYAHRNLVVHLDLKPSNILVTADGAPKLLDFGTSKLVPSDGLATTTIPVTPSYASPEQLRNEAVTTACDVYSLGVILFELLAGRRPAGESSMAAMIERAIEERNPPGLEQTVTIAAAENRRVTESRLRSLLAGDLSTIVRKCLGARPRDRYASVSTLADDIQRYLDGRPVLAQRQTTIYQLQKFTRRNRGKVTASALMMLALAASLGYAWWGQQQALREGQRALRMQTFLYRLFKMANSNVTGKPAATLPEFLRLGVKVLPEYIKNPADLRHAQLALAESMFFNRDYVDADRVYAQVTESATTAGDAAAEAEAQAYSGNIALQQGRADAALVHTARGLAASRRPAVSPRTRALSAVEYALVREDIGQRTEENVRLMEFAVKESVDHNLPAHEIGEALYYLGAVLSLRGRLEESQRRFEEALHAYSQDALALCDQVLVLDGLAALRENQARFEDGVLLYDRAYRASTTCAGAGDLQTLRIGAYMAGALIRTGRAGEGLQILERELPVIRRALPPRSVFLYEILSPLALAYIETGRYQDAEQAATELLGSFDIEIPAGDKRFGTTQFLLARALAGQGRYQEALAHAEAAEHILSKTPKTPFNEKAAGEALSTLAEIRKKVRNQ